MVATRLRITMKCDDPVIAVNFDLSKSLSITACGVPTAGTLYVLRVSQWIRTYVL
jgi:hypothetical protein